MLLNAEPQTQHTKGKPLMLLGNKLQMLQMEWNKKRRLLEAILTVQTTNISTFDMCVKCVMSV